MEISFEALRKVQLQERHQPTLSALEDGFYDEYLDFLKKSEEKLKENFSFDGAKAVENAKKSLLDTFGLRRQKIFFKALRDFQSGTVSAHGLAGLEKELYTGLIKLLSTHGFPEERKSDSVSVEVLADIPAFVGFDARPCGPFKTGQIVNLNSQQAAFLAKKGLARVIS